MRSRPVFFGFVAIILALPAFPQTFHVSPEGNDAWSGLLDSPNATNADGPFATLTAARDAIRARKANLQGTANAKVVVHEGVYTLTETFVLSAQDSGWRGGPITYTAAPGETVRIIGGKPVTGFTAVTDVAVLDRMDAAAKDTVLQADLKAIGITEFPALTPRGMGQPVFPSHIELFYQGQPMQLARWPNDDWTTIADAPNGNDGGMFTYEGDRPNRWTTAEDLWLHGYWTWDWADSFVKVARIDTDAHALYTEAPHGVYGYTKGKRFYALNLLEELDTPGEYFIDRHTGILYFWPPAPIAEGDAFVSVTEDLIQIEDASNIHLTNFTVELCRSDAVRVMNSDDCLIAGLTVRNTGGSGISVSGGTENTVLSCDLYNIGEGGIGLSGGDRPTLTPAGHRAINNHVYDYSRWVRTYRSAIALSGVGLTAAHNRIHDAPHTGIIFTGNDHVLEYNEVFEICRETGDVGAFYIGRDWTMRGHIIRHNYFHDITGPYTHGAMAVYLDDCASGVTIFGNVFVNASRAAFIGGGRDNIVENNIFMDCHPSVHIDARLTGWAKDYAERGSGWNLEEKLEAMNWKEPPYSTRYPALVNVLDDEPTLPKGNRILRNISLGGKWLDLYDNLPQDIAVFENNLVDGDPKFQDAATRDFRLAPDSPALALGFEPIPLAQIGLHKDDYRTTTPEKPFKE